MSAIDIIEYLEVKGIFKDLPVGLKILDFGCGKGELVVRLRELGWDAYGVDVTTLWGEEMTGICNNFLAGYRIPFNDNEFDLVVSTSVMEHVQNKLEAFCEIRRILKPGSYAVHAFPSKFFLPLEPHLKVPLISWLYPKIPKIYLSFFAILGFRNIHQQNLSWREVRDANAVYVRDGLNYWSRSKYLACLKQIYSQSRFDDTYASCGEGTVARIDRKISNIAVRKKWRQCATLIRNQLLLCKK